MRRSVALLLMFSLTACKEMETQKAITQKDDPKQPGQTLLKTEGCSVHQTRGVVKIECSDGSQSESGVPRIHIKDAQGQSLTNLQFLQNWGKVGVVALNKSNGHILSYDAAGNLARVVSAYYETSNCTGRAFFNATDFIVKNKIYLNAGGAPNNVAALKVTGFSAAATSVQSKYENGSCTTYIDSPVNMTILEETELDSADPTTLSLPIEIEFEAA